MPNQRDPNKKLFSVALDKKLLAEVQAAADKMGITRVEFLRLAAAEKVQASKKQTK